MIQDYSLYIHIPFCKKKCPYCHFYVLPENVKHKHLLLESLEKEWALYKHQLEDKKLTSIYLGGGTPSLLQGEEIFNLLSLFPIDDQEVTLEANPDGLNLEKLNAFKQAGINRLSIGVQSFSPSLLLPIQRQHSAEEAIQSIYWAKQAGFDNISIDLMYDLPKQTLKDWKESLEQATQLPITHLSLYNLVIEEHTVFYKYREQINREQASEKESSQMYLMAREHFKSKGWEQYELSAFCQDSYRSCHNSGYWTARPFIGLGPSAYSFWKGRRYRNTPRLHLYAKHIQSGHLPLDDEDSLSHEERLRELLCIHLRLIEGVPLDKVPPFNEISPLIEEGFLEKKKGNLCLTERGLLFYDTVAATLI